MIPDLETDNVGHEETTALSEEAEDSGLDDNWDEADTLSSHENTNPEEHAEVLSRKSSTTTLTSGISKRAYEEVDLDDFDDDDDFFDTAASSPSELLPSPLLHVSTDPEPQVRRGCERSSCVPAGNGSPSLTRLGRSDSSRTTQIIVGSSVYAKRFHESRSCRLSPPRSPFSTSAGQTSDGPLQDPIGNFSYSEPRSHPLSRYFLFLLLFTLC